MRASRLLILALGSLAFVPQAAGASPALAPHRAVYDLTLERASDRSGISGIDGRMVYEFAGSPCEGYTVTFRFVTRIATNEVSRLTDQQTTTFEEPGGDSFSFVNRSYVDQTLEKEVRGVATIEDGATVVELEKPEQESLDLPATQFPTQHLVELIEKAESGETFYQTTLFDGSEDADRVMMTTVIIGKASSPKETDSEADALGPLAADGFWPVNIAYFDGNEGGGEELPVYQTSFKLHANGVTRDLVMDYGEFAMKGKLAELSLLDAPESCSD